MQACTTFKTKHARRYAEALCGHFGSKAMPAGPPYDACIAFVFGQCRLLHTDEHLELWAQAPGDAELNLLKEVMTSHLDRFAFRENPRLIWQTIAEPSAEDGSKDDREKRSTCAPEPGRAP